MSSKDTVQRHITKKTDEEIERIRKSLAKDLGMEIKDITKKQAEIAFRLKALNGKSLLITQERDIVLGKIK